MQTKAYLCSFSFCKLIYSRWSSFRFSVGLGKTWPLFNNCLHAPMLRNFSELLNPKDSAINLFQNASRLLQSDLRKQSCFYSRQIIIKQMVDPQFAYFPFWEDFVGSGISKQKTFSAFSPGVCRVNCLTGRHKSAFLYSKHASDEPK